MTDLTAQEMIATILRSLEKTGRRFSTNSKPKVRATQRTWIARRHSKSKSQRTAAGKRGKIK